MNRRQMTRLGLMGGLLLHRSALHAIGADSQASAGHSVPMEPLPEMAAQEPVASLGEEIAQGRIRAGWVSQGPNQVRVTLKNLTDRPISICIDPGTVLSDGQSRWLAGNPTNDEGAFGGHFVFDPAIGRSRIAAIPTRPGPELNLILPAVSLSGQAGTSKSKPGTALKAESIEAWSSDKAVVTALKGLSALGASLPVAQGIAWRSTDSQPWKAISVRVVQGRVLNEFEKLSVDRYLAEVAKIGDVAADELRNRLMDGLLEVVVRPAPGKAEAARRLVAILKGREWQGLPLKPVFVDSPKGDLEKPMRLDFHIVEAYSLDPSKLVVDCALSSNPAGQGAAIRWAKSRLPFGGESADQAASVDSFLDDLTARFAAAVIKCERIATGSMYSRFRLENRSPWTIAAVAMRTDRNRTDPAVWPVHGLGLSPRGRTIVPIPSERAEPIDLRWSPI